jgi:transmembrane sensor
MNPKHWPRLREHPVRPQSAEAWVARLLSDQCTQQDKADFTIWCANYPHQAAKANIMLRQMEQVSTLAQDPFTSRQIHRIRHQGYDRRALIGGGLVAMAASVTAAFFMAPALRRQTYETAIGETRQVTLSDGSHVIMSSHTRLKVDYNKGQRRLWLETGQARFEVAKDTSRPFRVFAAKGEVRALGTIFDVRSDGQEMRVVLEEGEVALFTKADEATLSLKPTTRLKPGQLAETKAGRLVVKVADIKVTGAWRFGLMILENRPLSDAVAEINRFNVRQIIINDPTIASLSISGVFQSGRPDAFADAVATAFPIEVVRRGDNEVELRAAQTSRP